MLGLGFWDQVQKVRTLTAFWGPKVRVRSTRVRTKGLGCTKPTNQIAVLFGVYQTNQSDRSIVWGVPNQPIRSQYCLFILPSSILNTIILNLIKDEERSAAFRSQRHD
jgi:hypothetical protein